MAGHARTIGVLTPCCVDEDDDHECSSIVINFFSSTDLVGVVGTGTWTVLLCYCYSVHLSLGLKTNSNESEKLKQNL